METPTLVYGAMVRPLDVQLAADGIAVPDGIESFQQDADAITRLSRRGVLTDRERMDARQRLGKMITEAVNQQGPR